MANLGTTEATELKERRKKVTKRTAESAQVKLLKWADMENVAEDFTDDESLGRLSWIGDKVKREYEIDESSRTDWKEMAEKALNSAKLKREPKSYPFAKASNIKYPLIATASQQFAARAYPAIVDGKRIVKAQVLGDDRGVPALGPDGQQAVNPQTGEQEWQIKPGLKRNKADRIGQHMSYQIANEMPEWEEDTDMLLHQIPIVGCAFRKVWWDPVEGRNRSEMIPALDFVVHSCTKSLDSVPRATHVFELYPHEIEERINEGMYLDIIDELGSPMLGEDDTDAPHEFLEQHRLLDLDEDGYREPWIVTVHKETAKVVRIVANYDPEDVIIENGRLKRLPRYKMFVKYGFLPDPEGGFYDVGFGELLQDLSAVIDTTINQMLDAAHLQNAGGGFIGSGLRLKKNQIRFAPGEYHVVEAAGGKIRDSVYNMEHPGPSNVLFQLLGMMIDAGREVANVKDVLTGDQPRSQPATTTLALIEQGMKVYTAIYKRIYRSLRREYKLLFKLNARYLEDEAYFTVLDNPAAVARSDYDEDTMDVMPVADPTLVTDMQKMARAQIYHEMAGSPGFQAAGGDPREAMLRFLEAMGAEDVDKLLPPKPPQANMLEQLQMKGAEEQLKGQMANTEKTKAETQKKIAEIAKTEGQANKIMHDIQTSERDGKDAEYERNMQAALLQLMGQPANAQAA